MPSICSWGIHAKSSSTGDPLGPKNWAVEIHKGKNSFLFCSACIDSRWQNEMQHTGVCGLEVCNLQNFIKQSQDDCSVQFNPEFPLIFCYSSSNDEALVPAAITDETCSKLLKPCTACVLFRHNTLSKACQWTNVLFHILLITVEKLQASCPSTSGFFQPKANQYLTQATFSWSPSKGKKKGRTTQLHKSILEAVKRIWIKEEAVDKARRVPRERQKSYLPARISVRPLTLSRRGLLSASTCCTIIDNTNSSAAISLPAGKMCMWAIQRVNIFGNYSFHRSWDNVPLIRLLVAELASTLPIGWSTETWLQHHCDLRHRSSMQSN